MSQTATTLGRQTRRVIRTERPLPGGFCNFAVDRSRTETVEVGGHWDEHWLARETEFRAPGSPLLCSNTTDQSSIASIVSRLSSRNPEDCRSLIDVWTSSDSAPAATETTSLRSSDASAGNSICMAMGTQLAKSKWSNSEAAQPRSAENFMTRATKLEKLGRSDAALDLVYDSVDDLMHRGKFDSCASVLSGVNVANCSVDLLVGLLTATLPARSRIPFRTEFFEAVERELRRRGELDPGVLAGLA